MPSAVRIEVVVSQLYRSRFEGIRRRVAPDISLEFMDSDNSSNLELESGLHWLSIVARLVSWLLAYQQSRQNKNWTLQRVQSVVELAAAEFLEQGDVVLLSYEGVGEFLRREVDVCLVVAEVADEIYTFEISRTGSVLVVKSGDYP